MLIEKKILVGKEGFKNKVLMLGYGAVARCTLPLLLKYTNVPIKNVTIIDFLDKSDELKQWTRLGARFEKKMINKRNLESTLSRYLGSGDVLVDLSYNIDCCAILKWCKENEVLYVNTSVERWDPKSKALEETPYEKSLYYLYMRIRKLTKNWKGSPTAVLEHGANPGLISHFTKKALVDISNELIQKVKVSKNEAQELRSLIDSDNFAQLSRKIGVKVIHCSERDTQVTSKPKQIDEFVGTWSIEGFREEGTAPSEIGWGTHEKAVPNTALRPPIGPKNQIFLAQMGINTMVRSWIPDEEILGMVIRHGEAFSISDHLTVWEDGKPVYRPTVHYAYMPCQETISSLYEFRARGYEMQPKIRIMHDDIVGGADILGALVMGHKLNSWWTGSVLTIQETRKLAPHQNATTLQVAIGVVAAVMWMVENPRKGICFPDDLPHEYVLDIARPYLGKLVSVQSDWTPIKNRKVFFKQNSESILDRDLWSFQNFRFVP